MERIDFRENFEITRFEVDKIQNNTVLTWQYVNADYFLIFVNDGTYEFQLENALNELANAGVDGDKAIHTRSDTSLIENEDSKFRVFCLPEKEFYANKKNFIIPASGMKRNIAYEVHVYACSNRKHGFRVYDAKGDENVRFIQAVVRLDVDYKKKFLKKDCIGTVKVTKLDDYKDGAVMYHVDGVDSDFPLPETCLGKNLTIMLPDKLDINIRIKGEYKKYYKKAEVR